MFRTVVKLMIILSIGMGLLLAFETNPGFVVAVLAIVFAWAIFIRPRTRRGARWFARRR